MENNEVSICDIFKYIIYIFIAIWSISNSHSQSYYTSEYYTLSAQRDANKQIIKILENEKQTLSIMKTEESIKRSRIQAVISAKQNENFRLQRKIDYFVK